VKAAINFLTLALLLGFNLAQAQPEPTAWVVNSLGETLSNVNLNSGQVTLNALMLGDSPNDLVITGTTGYVVNSLSNHVQTINLITQTTTGTIEIYRGINPWSIALDGDGLGFVPNFLTGNVSVLDLEAGSEIDAINVGGAPESACVFANSIFITDVNYDMGSGTFGPGRLHAYSLPDLIFRGTVEVGTNPQVVKPGPDGLLHVVCTGNYAAIPGQVDLVDAGALTVETSIPIGGSPGSLAFSSDYIAYLGAGGWGGGGAVLSYDAQTHQILHSAENAIPVPSAAMGIAVTSSDHVLVCCFPTDQIAELDSEGNSLRIFGVGDGPVTLAVWEPPSAVKPPISGDMSFNLSWNFPEPFNSSTTIVYTILAPAPVTLKVFDLSGRMWENRALGFQPVGENRLSFKPPFTVGSGILFYSLQSGRWITSGFMIYMK